MKNLAGILSISLLILTGCGRSKPAVPGGPPVGTLSQQEIDEKHAANFLMGAKDFRNEGHPEYATKTLEELLEQFPDSEAAVEAKKLIAEIEENESDGEETE